MAFRLSLANEARLVWSASVAGTYEIDAHNQLSLVLAGTLDLSSTASGSSKLVGDRATGRRGTTSRRVAGRRSTITRRTGRRTAPRRTAGRRITSWGRIAGGSTSVDGRRAANHLRRRRAVLRVVHGAGAAHGTRRTRRIASIVAGRAIGTAWMVHSEAGC